MCFSFGALDLNNGVSVQLECATAQISQFALRAYSGNAGNDLLGEEEVVDIAAVVISNAGAQFNRAYGLREDNAPFSKLFCSVRF
jgi:hypothetical protein